MEISLTIEVSPVFHRNFSEINGFIESHCYFTEISMIFSVGKSLSGDRRFYLYTRK